MFNPKNTSNQKFLIKIAQLNHIVFIVFVVLYLIWGLTREFMKGHTEQDENKRLFFIFSIILFSGIGCLIKVNAIQAINLLK